MAGRLGTHEHRSCNLNIVLRSVAWTYALAGLARQSGLSAAGQGRSGAAATMVQEAFGTPAGFVTQR
jgi:hypothetical protein